ncbi:MAG: aspartate kinase [Bacteroidales bacterium]|nr:aspartate kinase [Bacteroidales bacterium]
MNKTKNTDIQSLKIYKFGGASVKNADAVRNIAKIIANPSSPMIIVVSAMGKTTNALEKVVDSFFNGKQNISALISEVENYHLEIIHQLFNEPSHKIFKEIDLFFYELREYCSKTPSLNYDFEYDQIVSYGEIISTKIIDAFINDNGIKSVWIDIRSCLKTTNHYRDANVLMEISKPIVIEKFNYKKHPVIFTQGFIGSTTENITTTLGREGSDFTGAILANILNAQSLTIWKDVPGILNADPKWFDNTEKLNHISYLEAIELAYYGATIIHPKTIKPLQNKNIPLFVKSFINPNDFGSVINDNIDEDSRTPSFIFKMNQVLISIRPRDFSFIMEEALSEIFGFFAEYRLKINMMQNSALSFSVSVDYEERKIQEVINRLKEKYRILYNTGLELVTIRHYNQKTIDRVTINKEILVEQKSRTTARFIMKDLSLIK